MGFRDLFKATPKHSHGIHSQGITDSQGGGSRAYEPYRENSGGRNVGQQRFAVEPRVQPAFGSQTLRSQATNCQTCARISEILNNPGQRVSVGTLNEIMSVNCKWHRPIFEFAISKTPSNGPAHLRVNMNEPLDAISGNVEWKPSLTIESIPARIHSRFDLLRKGSTSTGLIFTRDLGQWIDTNHVLKAMKSCRCLSGLKTRSKESFCPKFLIDVKSMSLKPATAEDDYVALSYVWGDVSTFLTIKSNVQQLQKRKGVESSLSQIPNTVLDAICLTRELKERYIWIDALCIIQDDNITKGTEILHMAEIYENATFTIIAANGDDAAYGLRGLARSHRPQPRREARRKFELSDGAIIIESVGRNDSRPTKWKSRGWTFQENMFSKRHLMFAGEQVSWNCPCSTWQENKLSMAPSEGSILETQQQFFNNLWPDLLHLSRMIQDYQKTQLKFPEDVEHAFSGIATRLSEAFVGGFNYGLPHQFFDLAILWSSHSSKCTRRIPVKNTSKPLPSWSWMGWVTEFDFSYNHLPHPQAVLWVSEPLKTDVWLQFVPIVNWYMIADDGRIPIQSSWCQYMQSAADNEEPLPAGWQRQFNSQTKESYFTNDRIPDTKFRYPIPIKSQTEKAKLSPNISLIGCDAQRNFFYSNESYWRYERSPYFTRRKTHAGYFESLLPEVDEEERKRTPRRYEVVAISQSTLSQADFNRRWQLKVNQPPKQWEETKMLKFYNVLLVEWREGVAYRTGVGVVFENAWKEHAKECEWIDLVLG